MRTTIIIIAAIGLAFAVSYALSFMEVNEDTASRTVAPTPQRPTPTPTPLPDTPTPTPTPHIFTEKRLWTVVNEWQENQGHDPYIEDQRLCDFASERLNDVKTLWSHEGFVEKKNVLLSDWSNVGENLAKDFSSAEETLNAWLTSPSHRENLLDVYYAYSCIRCEITSSHTMCVQIFGNKIPPPQT